MRILNELVRQKPVYLLNSVNPYRIEGQKTAALELLEQLGWEPPDHIIVPGGNLGNSSAIGKALLEMRELKLIARLPKLSIIQAQGANPVLPQRARTRRDETRAHDRRYHGDRDPHRQPRVLEEGTARPSANRRRGRAGH